MTYIIQTIVIYSLTYSIAVMGLSLVVGYAVHVRRARWTQYHF